MSATRELLFVDVTPVGVSTRLYAVGTRSDPRPLSVGKDNKYIPLLHEAVRKSPRAHRCKPPSDRRWIKRATELIATECQALADELREQVKVVAGGIWYRGDDIDPVQIFTDFDLFDEPLAGRSAGEKRIALDAEVILRLSQQPEGR